MLVLLHKATVTVRASFVSHNRGKNEKMGDEDGALKFLHQPAVMTWILRDSLGRVNCVSEKHNCISL